MTGPIATEAGPTQGIFTISRAEATDATIVVNFTVAGTARSGDYVPLPTSATIPAGAVSVDVPVLPIDDSALESNETVVLTLRGGSGYVLGSPLAGTVTIVSDDVAPDLTVGALTVPAQGGPGLTLTVTDTTRNQGTGPSGVSTTSFYLSVNTLLDAGDTLFGTRAAPELPSAINDTATTVLTVPSATAAGSYYLIAKADGPGQVSESNEINNSRVALVRIGPDLAITALTAPATAGAGATIAVTETTKNQGGGGAGDTSTRFYLSTNFSLDAGDMALDARSVDPLGVGSSSTAITNLTIPVNVTSGSFYIIAAADDGHAVPEPIENNNTRYALVRIGADLVVSALSAPTRAATGAAIAVADTIRNMGGGGAGVSTTAFFLSTNLTLDAGDVRLPGTRAVDPLDAGASSVGTTTITLPPVAAGTWYLLANADDNSQVSETQETNNVRYTTLYLGPDLTIPVLNAPFTVVAGAAMTVTDTVRNLGVETAAASTTRFYLSLNTMLDAADIVLTQRDVPALGPNATNSGSTTIVIPAGLSGRYYLLAVADSLATVVESSESNNVVSRQVTINPGS